jgi:GNAT superfamily N-acetyltransferase
VDEVRLDEVRDLIASARDAGSYRIFTFTTPWPERYHDDHCELMRRMSTDEPAGDGERGEELWDQGRVDENQALLAARGAWKLAAVAEHVPSGRLVAVTELLVAPDAPQQAWQMETLVLPDHRGRRLGLAVKLANLEELARAAPDVRLVVTGNAKTNAPMIAVNDALGFEIAGEGAFWQKAVDPQP